MKEHLELEESLILNEFGNLLSFVSKVAITLRMNSEYCTESQENNMTAYNVMWLSDMLHNLNGIGNSLADNNISTSLSEINSQISYWLRHKENIERALENTPCPQCIDWCVDDGVSILTSLKNALEKLLRVSI